MPSTLSELWSRRHLLWVLTTSNIKRTNKHSTLGWLWWLLDPILLGTVYYVLASMLFERRANQPFALYLIIGLVSFKAFNEAVTQSAAVIRGRTAIVRAVSFPKMVLPLSLVLSSTFFFLFSLVVVALLASWYGPRYGTWPSLYYALLPAVIACQVLFSVGIALMAATAGVYFEDARNIVGHLMRVWYYLSPGLYSLDQIPERYHTWLRLNPFTRLMTMYRAIMMEGRPPDPSDYAMALAMGVGACAVGYWVFRRHEGGFVSEL